MALKASESFIRFVSMGAAGAHRAVEILGLHGHDARELERYATCNKIWQHKIKRLRMPDLFCLRCGTAKLERLQQLERLFPRTTL